MSGTFDDSEGWTRFDYGAPDGLVLSGRKYGFGHADSLPVICLPGLTRNAADFHELALHLSRDAARPRPVLALDYRGRGLSQRDRNWRNYDVLTEAGDVLAAAEAAGIGEAAFVGTSRGGMITMILSAMRPALIACAVLNDIGPQIEPRGLVRIRSYLEKDRDYPGWDVAAATLKAAGQNHFPAWDDGMWMRQARRMYLESGRKIVRRYDPALLKTLAEIDFGHPLPTMWPQFAGLGRVPVIAIRGENSDIFAQETLERMQELHPRLESITVPGQRHAPDLGTEDLPRRIATFIASAEAKRAKARGKA
ncbi:MAG TPA: alpha/beta hydrolase [Rhizobiaceae bacterium]|nr:alpha/beta hydrolase [Rhizobiaceae bacterium]